MKLIPEKDVIKVKEDKRNTKKRYLITDGICFKCGCIVNYCYEKRCILCCGSDEFLIGEPGKVLRELLELDIEQIRIACELRGGGGFGSRTRMVISLFEKIFPRLCKVDNRIDEFFLKKIVYRNRKRFRYIADIENILNDIKKVKDRNRRRIKTNIRLISIEEMAN